MVFDKKKFCLVKFVYETIDEIFKSFRCDEIVKY